MKKLLQIQLRRYYKYHTNCKELEKYIGCDRDYFKEYIDSKLIDPMNFINIGKIWHFDHIVPLDLFKTEEYYIAWNYQNIYPMLAKDNKKKGSSTHFSLQLLKKLPNSEINSILIRKCEEDIINTYSKYLL